MVKIEKAISEEVNSCVQREKFINSMFTNWDSSILKNWKSIKLSFDCSLLKNATNKIDKSSVKWIPPQDAFAKLNFNGASKSELGQSGAGIYIRNSSWDILAVSSTHLVHGTNNSAKAQALLLGLELAS